MEMHLGRVESYLAKYAEVLPKADGTQVKLEGKKVRIKKSALEEWRLKGLEGGICLKCEVEVKRLTVDHIVPVHILASLDNAVEIATGDEENFQFLCEICNRRKSGTLDMRNPKTAQLLQKYIQPYLKESPLDH